MMTKRIGIPDLLEVRWYGFGGLYVVGFGRIWITLKRGSTV